MPADGRESVESERDCQPGSVDRFRHDFVTERQQSLHGPPEKAEVELFEEVYFKHMARTRENRRVLFQELLFLAMARMGDCTSRAAF